MRDEPLDVGRAEVGRLVGALDARRLPLGAAAEGQRLDLHVGRRRDVGGPPTGIPRLEGDEPARAGLGHGTAGQRGVEEGGLLGPEHVVGVVLVGHPQRHAQVGVGAQVVLDDAGGTLRREDEVQAERTAALGDVDDAVDELRHLLDEGGELVDDDDERRRGVDLAAPLELDEVLGLVPGEQVLAVVQLGRERRERAAHEVRRQVGDEADRVRQLDAVAEGRAALVVDEQEGDALRRVRGGHAEDPRLEQLGLAGTGRATDERVRAVGADVDGERALARLSDDGAQVAGLARQDAPAHRGR